MSGAPGATCMHLCPLLPLRILVPLPLPLPPLLQVRIGSRWGTVCGRGGFDDAAARVVCRALGLDGGRARPNAHFGRGSLPILMSDVHCKGGESGLAVCDFGAIATKCNHGMDVGVVCKSELLLLPLGALTT